MQQNVMSRKQLLSSLDVIRTDAVLFHNSYSSLSLELSQSTFFLLCNKIIISRLNLRKVNNGLFFVHTCLVCQTEKALTQRL